MQTSKGSPCVIKVHEIDYNRAAKRQPMIPIERILYTTTECTTQQAHSGPVAGHGREVSKCHDGPPVALRILVMHQASQARDHAGTEHRASGSNGGTRDVAPDDGQQEVDLRERQSRGN